MVEMSSIAPLIGVLLVSFSDELIDNTDADVIAAGEFFSELPLFSRRGGGCGGCGECEWLLLGVMLGLDNMIIIRRCLDYFFRLVGCYYFLLS